MAPTENSQTKNTDDLTRAVADMARKTVKSYIYNHTQAEIQARLQAVPDLDGALGLAKHDSVITDLENGIREYDVFAQLFLLRGRIQQSEARLKKEEGAKNAVEDAEEPVESRASTPETEASTVVASSLSGEQAEEAKIEGREEQEEQEEDEGEDIVDFTDTTNSLSAVPKKGSQERAMLWAEMDVNTGVMQEFEHHNKSGRFFKSRDPVSDIPFEVNFKESSICPVITLHIAKPQDVNQAQALIESEASDEYLTQPAMPVMVTLKFLKPSKLAELKDLDHNMGLDKFLSCVPPSSFFDMPKSSELGSRVAKHIVLL